jgi:dephospho-CoA kinase
MKKRILVTGFSGVGKSTLARRLKELGYNAHDLEDIEGLFTARRADTGEILKHWDTTDLDTVKNFEWLCDRKKLEESMNNESAELSFYCGSATNDVDFLDLFTKVFVLVASHDVVKERLTTRTTNDWGKTQEVQAHILQNKEAEEIARQKAGAIVIDADQPLEKVTQEILKASGVLE